MAMQDVTSNTPVYAQAYAQDDGTAMTALKSWLNDQE
jgi:hypothetical protein